MLKEISLRQDNKLVGIGNPTFS